jgi:hypothetical protein
MAEIYQRQWQTIQAALAREVSQLPESERRWMTGRLARIGRLQRCLHRLFLAAGGPQRCQLCQGGCCDCGRNHLTLVNLLPFLLANESPPAADFNRICPFVGEQGCLLEPARRPFNCVIFLCDEVDGALSAAQRQLFSALEGRLRTLYLEFDRRYAGSSLRGIFIRSQALAGAPFLCPPATVQTRSPR